MAENYTTFHWYDIGVRNKKIPLNTFGGPNTSARAAAYRIDAERTQGYLKRHIFNPSLRTESILQVLPIKDVDGVRCYTVQFDVYRGEEKVDELHPVIPVKSVRSANEAAWMMARRVLSDLKGRVFDELDEQAQVQMESLEDGEDIPF